MIALLICYALFVRYWMAKRDARAIIKDGRVSHAGNGVIHGIWWGVGIFICLFTHAWLLLTCMPFIGRVVFDVSLNLWRGKEWNYVSPWLLSKSPAIRARVSVIDRMEYAVFKSAGWPKIIYIAIVLLLITIHYV